MSKNIFLCFMFAASLFLPLHATAAPDLVLPDMAGRQHAVREYIGQGKWTVVAIWSTDCPICRRDMPEMAFFHDAHRHRDAIVLGIAINGVARKPEIAEFIQDQGLDFDNLIGTPGNIDAFGYGFRGTPTYYVYSPTGDLMAHRVGRLTPETVEAIMRQGGMARF